MTSKNSKTSDERQHFVTILMQASSYDEIIFQRDFTSSKQVRVLPQTGTTNGYRNYRGISKIKTCCLAAPMITCFREIPQSLRYHLQKLWLASGKRTIGSVSFWRQFLI